MCLAGCQLNAQEYKRYRDFVKKYLYRFLGLLLLKLLTFYIAFTYINDNIGGGDIEFGYLCSIFNKITNRK